MDSSSVAIAAVGYILMSISSGQKPIINPELQTPAECAFQEKFMQQTYPHRETWCEPIYAETPSQRVSSTGN